jgi:hypothetical protein
MDLFVFHSYADNLMGSPVEVIEKITPIIVCIYGTIPLRAFLQWKISVDIIAV